MLRELSGWRECHALSELFATIWQSSEEQVVPKETLVASELSGHQLHGAFDGEEMVGGSWGFLTWDGATPSLHSHITGVLPRYQGTGLGFALKHAQRAWCLARSITTVTWTFDPMIARNAAFNLRKLGAVAVAYWPDHYGPMKDRFNEGEPTDRLEVRWDLAGVERPAPVRTVAIPADPAEARADRARIRNEMLAAFGDGLTAVGFDATRGYLFGGSQTPP